MAEQGSFIDWISTSGETKRHRATIREKARQKNLELQKEGFQVSDDGQDLSVIPNSAEDMERNKNELEIKNIQATLEEHDRYVNQTDLGNNLEEFAATGNADVINDHMNRNEKTKQAWAQQGVQMVTNIDFENDINLLKKSGIDVDVLQNPEAKEAFKRTAIKYHDGKQWQIGAVKDLVAKTGVNKVMPPSRVKKIMEPSKTSYDFFMRDRQAKAAADAGMTLEEQTAKNTADLASTQASTAKTRAQTEQMNTTTLDAEQAAALGFEEGTVVQQDGKGGLEVVQDPKEAPAHFRFREDGTLEPVPGGKVDMEIEEKENQAKYALAAAKGKADSMFKDVQGTIDFLDEKTAGLDPTGLKGAVSKYIPGSDANRLDGRIKTLQARLSFDELKAMKEASPTGGALGQVTERELDLLMSAVANLDLGLGTEDLRNNLQAVTKHYQNWIELMDSRDNPEKLDAIISELDAEYSSSAQEEYDEEEINALLDTYAPADAQ